MDAGTDDPKRFGLRYDIVGRVGEGAFGVVHAAWDRLDGRKVALKALRPEMIGVTTGSASRGSRRRIMVEEFRQHAQLRHPNIVRVEDFGFEGDVPYFTMEVLEGARPFLDGTEDLPFEARLDRVVQLLRALRYTHRQGLLHRDLKPENVLVRAGVVKVLDYGLALLWEPAAPRHHEIAGTFAWMAPEVVTGEPISYRSDLYAVGLLAFELLTGTPEVPDARDRTRPLEAYGAVTRGVPLEAFEVLPGPLRPVLERLLALRPADRFPDAGAVLAALAAAYPDLVAIEDEDTQEALITHARLVGREEELSALGAKLNAMLAGSGGVQLVGGESGVGKSRLLEQLLVEAVVQGCDVVRGQAIDGGGGPFEVWREMARWLALGLVPRDPRLEVLASIDPALTGGTVTPSSGDDVAACVAGLAASLERPLLLLLEDLHWAPATSRELLRFLAPDLARRRILVVGTYRDDEAPDLPALLDNAPTQKLGTLPRSAVRALVVGMLGGLDHVDEIAAFVYEQTQGLPLFVVEVVRDLAQRAGGLDEVRQDGLDEGTLTQRMREVLLRKLTRLGEEERRAIEVAAVAGRRIEEDLLATLVPGLALDPFLRRASAVAILRVWDGAWAFHHDKMREAVVATLRATGPSIVPGIHARVAEVVERLRPPSLARSMRLAHHWTEAGDREQSLRWSEAAGLEAVEQGAPAAAAVQLTRARELLGRPTPGPRRGLGFADPLLAGRLSPSTVRVARIESALASSAYALGDLARARDHGRRALVTLGFDLPRSVLREALGLVGGLVALASSAPFVRNRRDTDPLVAQARAAATTAHTLLTEAAFYADEVVSVVWSTIRHVRLALPGGPSHTLAEALMLVGLLFGMTPVGDYGGSLRARALGMARALGLDRTVAKLTNRVAVFHLGATRWPEAEQSLEEAKRVALRCGDRRTQEECRGMLGLGYFFQGWYDASRAAWSEGLSLSQQSGSRQLQCVAHLGIGDAYSRAGDVDAALASYERARPLLIPGFSITEVIWLHGNSALLLAERGDLQGALAHARESVAAGRGRVPLTYWMQHGLLGTAETFLRVSQRYPDTVNEEYRQARWLVRLFAIMFGNGRAAWAYLQGLEEVSAGRWSAAERHLRRALALADEHHMPYEAACARRELAALARRGKARSVGGVDGGPEVGARPSFVEATLDDAAA